MDVVFGAPTVANSTRGLFAERESMFTERQSAFVARENTPMSDNLSKRRIHYAKTPIPCRLLDLDVFFASYIAEYPT